MIRKRKIRRKIITLGFDPNGGKYDLMWKRLDPILAEAGNWGTVPHSEKEENDLTDQQTGYIE